MKKIVLGVGLFLLCASHVSASPILFTTNGHYYDLITPSSTNDWFSAKASANSSTYMGLSGHLATVTSAEENNFLISNFATGNDAFEGAWLGGKAPEGWLDGPEAGALFGYTNWGGVEPNNQGYAYMNIGNTGPNSMTAGEWADDSFVQGFPDSNFDPVTGYFVEYSEPVIPEPATVALLSTGLLGAFAGRKRFKR